MKREGLIKQMAEEKRPWDLLIIGGGATGLGVAVDASSRGYRVLLVEQHDFAKATSSRSTKLVHGGVRYLQQGDVSMVVEALHERGRLWRNAPHLVKDMRFIIGLFIPSGCVVTICWPGDWAWDGLCLCPRARP